MLRFGRAHARFLLDNVVKAQLRPLILAKRSELWRHGDVWIGERKHMTGADTALLREAKPQTVILIGSISATASATRSAELSPCRGGEF
jgi:hypothetical protein